MLVGMLPMAASFWNHLDDAYIPDLHIYEDSVSPWRIDAEGEVDKANGQYRVFCSRTALGTF